MDIITNWVLKIGNWEYDKEKPKKKKNNIDKIADMLLEDFKVNDEFIEAYTELITFSYVYDNAEEIGEKELNTDEIKSYIKINGGIEKIIQSFKTKHK